MDYISVKDEENLVSFASVSDIWANLFNEFLAL